MLEPALEGLAVADGGVYIDATAGAGGHSEAILQGLGADGRLIAIDRDAEAIELLRERFCDDSRVTIVHAPFSQLVQIAIDNGANGRVNGILFDLGVSSMQLDREYRGFSFQRDGELDMRMDRDSGVRLSEWLDQVEEQDLVQILKEYGEERFARRIARAIVKQQAQQSIQSTAELAALVAAAMPRHEREKHPATRTFQALRIAINDEFGELENGLEQSLELLAAGGRLVVISFHSLEDRRVKRFIQRHSQTDPGVPPELPVIDSRSQPVLKKVRIGKKPDKQELQANPRSRSAILRVAERTSTPLPEAEDGDQQASRAGVAGAGNNGPRNNRSGHHRNSDSVATEGFA